MESKRFFFFVAQLENKVDFRGLKINEIYCNTDKGAGNSRLVV